MSKYFLPGVAPLRESLPLASIVPNVKQPDQDAFPSPQHKAGKDYPLLKEKEDYWVQAQLNLGKLLDESSDTEFKTQVTKLLSSSFTKSKADTQWLSTCEVRKYQVRNPKSLFRGLIKRDGVRKWLQNEIEDGTDEVYFIVGYYTVLDAESYRGTRKGHEIGATGEVPVGDIVTQGAGALIPGMENLDVGASVKKQGGQSSQEGSYMPGERVYAFSYRKVTFSFFSLHNKAATAKLEHDNCWAMTADNRGEDDGEGDEGIEVELGEGDEDGDEGFDLPALEDPKAEAEA